MVIVDVEVPEDVAATADVVVTVDVADAEVVAALLAHEVVQRRLSYVLPFSAISSLFLLLDHVD